MSTTETSATALGRAASQRFEYELRFQAAQATSSVLSGQKEVTLYQWSVWYLCILEALNNPKELAKRTNTSAIQFAMDFAQRMAEGNVQF